MKIDYIDFNAKLFLFWGMTARHFADIVSMPVL